MKGSTAASSRSESVCSGSTISEEVGPSSSMSVSSVPLLPLSKKAKKLAYEKQLEEVNKELQLKSSSSGKGGGGGGAVKKQRMKPELEVMLLEQKCVLLLRLKRYKEVVDDGYSILGRLGPNVVVYKCILIALVKLGKNEDDLSELLGAWKKATPKCPQYNDTKRKFDGYFAALRSGMKHSDIFSIIEDSLGLHADAILSKHFLDGVDEKKWRFRPPPPRHTTFSLCPRSSSGSSCMLGENCVFAHSGEVLREWKSRVEGDKRNNNNSISEDDTEGSVSRSSGSGKKRAAVPISYRSLQIPQLCINYLQDLGKKIKEEANLKTVLADDISGVKFKVAPSIHLQSRIDGIKNVQCTWSFMVISRMPMGTVTILHDANRENFRISTATFYNKKKDTVDLIKLHPNNMNQPKLQVLNTFIQPALFLSFNAGWPDTCYYKVDVTYESSDPFPDPGLYRQSVIFDFKKDPKVVRNISLDILQKVDPIGNHLSEASKKPVWGITPATSPSLSLLDLNCNNYKEVDDTESTVSTRASTPRMDKEEFISRHCDFPSLNQSSVGKGKINNFEPKKVVVEPPNVNAVYDSETGGKIKIKGANIPGFRDLNTSGDLDNIFLADAPLTKDNYCTWMRNFLDVEFRARKKVVADVDSVVEVKIQREYVVSEDCLYRYDTTVRELYGKVEAISSIFSCDSKLEKLVTTSCSSIVISDVQSGVSSKRFVCKMIEKSKASFVVAIGRQAADELLLLSNTTRQLRIQFVLDSSYIGRVKRSLEVLNQYHMEFLFPSFEKDMLPFLKIMDGVGYENSKLIGEEEQYLNARKSNVYNLLTGRKILIDANGHPPPLLLLGGVSTGKSYLIARCIRALLRSYHGHGGALAQRILICTQSELAADTYITKYLHPWFVNDQLSIQRSKPLRVYGEDRFVGTVSETVKRYCLFTRDGTKFRFPAIEEVLEHKTIIVTLSTCAELIRLGLNADAFSHIILDEVGPCLEAEYVQPIVLAGRKTKVLISGDIMRTQSQMFSVSKGVPPLSILERLRNIYPPRHPYVVNLIENYINHEVIVKFLSQVYYNNQLLSASNELSHNSFYPLSIHHIPTSSVAQSEDGRGCYNFDEVRYIVNFLEDLLQKWPASWGSHEESIGIFTSYHNQIIALQTQLQMKRIQIDDVQLLSHVTPAKKYRVVILSTVRSYTESDGLSNGCFFTDRKLLFNAFSCAKNLVAAFGHASSLINHGACSDIWRKFITESERNGSARNLSPTLERHLEAKVFSSFGTPGIRQQENIPVNGGTTKFYSQNNFNSPSTPITSTSHPTLMHTENISPRHGMEFSCSSGINQTKPVLNHVSDYSWNIQSSSIGEPLKTDLFSAFSSNTGPLYSSRSPLTLSQEANITGKIPGENEVKTSVPLYRPPHLNGMIKSKRPVKPAPEPNMFEHLDSKLLSMNLAAQTQFPTPAPVIKPLMQMYQSPFQLPSVSPTTILDELPSTFQREVEPPKKSDVFNVKERRHLVPPTSPQPLFDQKFVLGNSNASFHPVTTPKPRKEAKNSAAVSAPVSALDTSLISPLLRGPPGFAPISLMESNIGHPSYPENKLSYSTPPHKAAGNGSTLTSSKTSSYKRSSGFEVPPRMLKNLHLSPANYRSPTRSKGKGNSSKKAAPAPAREMNFFEELGFSSKNRPPVEADRSESVASSLDAHSLIDEEETISIVEDGNAPDNLVENNDWIEVKSVKKGKHPPGKKVKARRDNHGPAPSRARANGSGDGVSVESDSEMRMDDKVDIITQMGFSKSSVIKALHACDKDLQRAVDWLISKTNGGTSDS